MPLSDGYKAIDAAWASAVAANRIDPTDSTLDPPIVIANGWPDRFSLDESNTLSRTPRRRVFNELYYRRDSALLDIRNHGVLPWDAEVDTLQGGVKQVSGVMYRALVNNGPTYGNATNPTASGQTVWEVISGEITLPGVPNAPAATTPQTRTLDWTWNCPLDGGAVITAFDFQWRVQGQPTWSAAITVTTPRYLQSGLVNGTTYEARVLARNSQGDSAYSNVGTATPSGTVPEGGFQFALRAEAGDTEVDLTWLEPDDGGETIINYTVEWRASGQAYAVGRRATSSDTMHTVTGLANGTLYFFRVYATNSEGDSVPSGEASATPVAPVVPPPPPVPTAPDAPTLLAGMFTGGNIFWQWQTPSDGGEPITGYQIQWREEPNAYVDANVVDINVGSWLQVPRNEVSITIPNTNWQQQTENILWFPPASSAISLGDKLAAVSGTELYLAYLGLARTAQGGDGIVIWLNDGSEAGNVAGPEFSDQMEMSGTITLTASNNDSLTITGIGDTSEPYAWDPSNITALRTFATTLAGLGNRSLTVVFNDNGGFGSGVTVEARVRAINNIGTSGWSTVADVTT